MTEKLLINLVGDGAVRLWGLSGRERLQRMLAETGSAFRIVENLSALPETARVLLINANYLYDGRVLGALLSFDTLTALVTDDGHPVAILGLASMANMMQTVLEGEAPVPDALAKKKLADIQIGMQQTLKKKDFPYVFPVSEANRVALERELFAASYKGVTDLVTKWLWPLPASLVTSLCVRLGLQPNHVTILSLVFAILAGWAFWEGEFGLGLLLGWLMTFLDTVDGKLARVTLTSSKAGDILDHGLDIVHPPLWYWAWGAGVMSTVTPLAEFELLIWLMFLGYVGGRLCEGAFQLWLAPFDLFIWRKADSFNRLITARRNPNLLMLTTGWLAGRPDIGLLLVICWHLLSTLILVVRLVMAWREHTRAGMLHSWMEPIDPVQNRDQLAVRVFTRVPLARRYDKTDPNLFNGTSGNS
ncbi:MAG: CDP-alcohol phosphatidyltransferase family protein [Nitrosomonas sp.]|nr:CDP-alcohol phosphatidyltransferase family protein [Nitrosomonas sp.]